MYDLTIRLKAGDLALMGEALGRAGISIEGGAAFADAPAHFLVEDGAGAKAALAHLDLLAVRKVATTRLRQDLPGQLGACVRKLLDAGVTIDALYSDHAGQLIIVSDQLELAERTLK